MTDQLLQTSRILNLTYSGGNMLNEMRMSQRLIDELGQENLCTHFILPLLKLSKISFLSSNFVDSYLTHDGKYILVEVLELMFLSRRTYTHHPNYECTHRGKNEMSYIVVYKIPQYWENDVHDFVIGDFSKMSSIAKEYIRRYSKLAYRIRDEVGMLVTDGRLLALERHTKLKEMWERELGVYLNDKMELLSIPPEKSFMELEELISIE